MRTEDHLIFAIVCFVAVIALYIVASSIRKETFSEKLSPFNTISAPIQVQKMDDPTIFTFANNRCDPKCCGSSDLMCKGGCVCKTDEQEKMFLTRGYNSVGVSEI